MTEWLLFPEAEPQPPTRCKTACFTGHRPEKLSDGAVGRVVMSMLYEEIRFAVEQGVDTFYTGMAPGIDLCAAAYVLQLRQQHSHLRLICVKPFADCGRSLRGSALYQFNSVLTEANAVLELSDHYHASCYRVRNQYMVDHSDLLIAVVKELHSGTGQTIRMAERRGLPVRKIDIGYVEQHLCDQHLKLELPPVTE